MGRRNNASRTLKEDEEKQKSQRTGSLMCIRIQSIYTQATVTIRLKKASKTWNK